jgi:hypothetical protein
MWEECKQHMWMLRLTRGRTCYSRVFSWREWEDRVQHTLKKFVKNRGFAYFLTEHNES